MYTKGIAVSEKPDDLAKKIVYEALGNDVSNQVIPLQQLEQMHAAAKELLEYLAIANTLAELYTLKTLVVKMRGENAGPRYAIKIPNTRAYIAFILPELQTGQELTFENLSGLHSGAVKARLDVQETLQLLFNQPDIAELERFCALKIISIWEDIQNAEQIDDLKQLYAEDLSIYENTENHSGYVYGNAIINVRININDDRAKIPYEIDFSWTINPDGKFTVSDLYLAKKQNESTRQNLEQKIVFSDRETENLFINGYANFQGFSASKALELLDLLNEHTSWDSFRTAVIKKFPSSNPEQVRINDKLVYSVRISQCVRLLFDMPREGGHATNVYIHMNYHDLLN
jgi:plasmid maintenance system killer protein